MALGIDELLEFLLEEIALRGEQGTSRDHHTANPHRNLRKIYGESSFALALVLFLSLAMGTNQPK